MGFLAALSFVLTFILGLYLTHWQNRFRSKKRLPGPINYFPFIGKLYQVGTQMEVTFMNWAKTYGKMFRVKMGSDTLVVLDDYKLIKEACSLAEFSGRPDNQMLAITSGGPIGVLFSQGDLWKHQRRFTLRNLRDFGLGKKSMETLILDEAEEVMEYFGKHEGKPIAVNHAFSLAVVNSLLQISCGKRYSQNDETLKEMLSKMEEILKNLGATPLMFLPWFRHLAPELSGYNKYMTITDEWKSLYEATVDEHIKTFDPSRSSRDFIDQYLLEISKTTDTESSFYGLDGAGRTNLVAIIGDIFVAGSETSSNILNWSILLLSAHPEIQVKVQEEIERVIGQSRLPSVVDKTMMPFVEATIMEIHRFATITPFGAPHSTMEDVQFHGFYIPKNSWVMTNFYSVNHNVEIWGDPGSFRPERFLRPDGQGVVKHEAFMPFGTGKRQCLGESLARDTHFLFLVSIFQRFSVAPDPEIFNSNFECDSSLVRKSKPFRVIFKDRQSKSRL